MLVNRFSPENTLRAKVNFETNWKQIAEKQKSAKQDNKLLCCNNELLCCKIRSGNCFASSGLV